ncbi:phosphatidate cytidylyltransferase [Trueperella bialowiezensis]|uniref:Phosphatidate cytidylyltransferase n=1 Tax=Trueperella bialowiezensis TaxID=312285 RepID=A0A3S4V5Q8_9ACTO|nr:phosphatidate cytidylyltransferase [Trueperella bialowiezensis]VEI12672.1 Phosphatidate cytidylyltransferase [Trueperella bialowiezensis]
MDVDRSVQAASFWARLAPRPPQPPRESTSRAGRNLWLAVPTALVLLAIVWLALFIRIEIFVGLIVVALSIALWEMAGALLVRDFRIPIVPLLIGQAIMLVVTWTHGLGGGLITYFLTCAVAMVWCWRRPAGMRDALAGCFSVAWLGVMGMFAVAMAAMPDGAWVSLAFILLPVASDTGGWLAGVLFGKHSIAPSISPKKSWEGFAGSVIGAALVAWLMCGYVLDLDWPWVAAFGLLTPVFATAGDFAESLLKRDLGVKDMGSIFPGHGGMLDRIDSMIFCAPVCYLLFALALGLF